MNHKRLETLYRFEILTGLYDQFKLNLCADFFKTCGSLC